MTQNMKNSNAPAKMNAEAPSDDYPFLPEPVPLSEQQWPDDVEPLVSVSCITYRHEPFIRQALDGILAQQTTFRVQVIIHDDASTDRTADIVREYASRHPQLITAICQEENQYSQGKRPSRLVRQHVTGKYVASCEGDDYWIDPLKLQKQVDVLEGHPEYGLVHGDCHKYFQDSGTWLHNANDKKRNTTEPATPEELFYEIIAFRYKIRTATVAYRVSLLAQLDPNRKVFPMGDTPMWLELSQRTRFYYIDEPLAVYRVQRNSMSKSTDRKRYFRFKLAMMEMRLYYCNLFGYDVRADLKSAYNKALLNYLLLDPEFTPEYPLQDPTPGEQRTWKRIQQPAGRMVMRTRMLAAALWNRLRRTSGDDD